MTKVKRFSDNLHYCYDEDGSELYTAPLRMESSMDLVRYEVEWHQVKRLFPGERFILFPTDNKDFADYQWRYINSEHSKAFARNRCQVPGKRGRLIRCRDTNSCARCPYGIAEEERRPTCISWDMEHEDTGFEPEDEKAKVEKSVLTRIILKELKDLMDRQDSRMMHCMEMRYCRNLPVKEIAAKYGISASLVYHLIHEAQRIGKNYLQAG